MTSTVRAKTDAGLTVTAQSYTFLQKLIYTESGIVLAEDKQYLVYSRLLPLAREAKMQSVDELCVFLSGMHRSHQLKRLVVDAMTTNETLFFRDRTMFDALRNQVFPELLKAVHGSRKLRIWSAAASTGQEAHSIAMLLIEMGVTPHQFEIVCTDISERVLERARLGRYTQFEVNRGLPASLLMKYFTQIDGEWQLSHEVSSSTTYAALDLRKTGSSLGQFDLVLCRNVLIYLDVNTRKQILNLVANRMAQGALLTLGCAETIINVEERYRRQAKGCWTFYDIEETNRTVRV